MTLGREQLNRCLRWVRCLGFGGYLGYLSDLARAALASRASLGTNTMHVFPRARCRRSVPRQ